MEHSGIAESRLMVVETRLAFCEQRMATLEGCIGGAIRTATRQRRELTSDERQAVRARLMAGQERARARREAEAKEQVKSKTVKSEVTS